jgi:hypothetical protein
MPFDVGLKSDGQRKRQSVLVLFGLPVSKSGILVEESP